MNKRFIYAALVVSALYLIGTIGSHNPAPIATPSAPVHVLSAAEQCAMITNPIPDCEAILSGKVTRPAFVETSKLDYGSAVPGTSNTHVFDTPTGSDDPRSANEIRLQTDLDRAQYGVRAAERHLNDVISDQIDAQRRALPYTGR
jgi:hypothetical protein